MTLCGTTKNAKGAKIRSPNPTVPDASRVAGAGKVRLGDVCACHSSNIRQKDLVSNSGAYPIFGAAGEITRVAFTQFDSACVGLVKDGAGVGRCMLLPAQSSIIGTMMALVPKVGTEVRFLKYLIESLSLGSLKTGATIPHVYFKDFADKIISLPLLAEQKRISDELDQLCALKKNAEDRLAILDQIVKSRFVEMFGVGKWPTTTIGELSEFLTSGSRGWAKYYSDEGELFITIKNVKNSRITVDDVQHIVPPQGAEADRTRVRAGDLLISITADLGRTGVVTPELASRGAYINQHLTRISLKRDVVDPLYAAFYIESPEGKGQIERRNQSAVKAGLNFESIRSIQLPLPPIDEQRKFAAFVSEVDKSKLTLRETVATLDQLYRAKLQEYFG